MKYSEFGNTGIRLSAVGIGTNRFPSIERGVEVLSAAFDLGVNYVDVGINYSGGKAFDALRIAMQGREEDLHITVKLTSAANSSAEETVRHIKETLQKLHLKKASFLCCWSVMSYAEYERIMLPGGMYDGILEAKRLGLCDHICVTTHAPPDEIIRILEGGRFEGVTISISPINAVLMQPVLRRAKELNIGVIAMNPAGGGVIPQNADMFAFLKQGGDGNVVAGALNYLLAYDGLDMVLSGASTVEQISENVAAVANNNLSNDVRITNVMTSLKEFHGFCSGCKYCDGCPQGIEIYKLMHAYNSAFVLPLPEPPYKHIDSKEKLENYVMCKALYTTFNYVPEIPGNPCIDCGRCEEQCTQRLPIAERIAEMYRRFEMASYSRQQFREHCKRVFEPYNREDCKVAFYPAGNYTTTVLTLLRETLPDYKAQLMMFDTSPNVWGSENLGVTIQPPEQIEKVKPDVIVISNYVWADEIYEQIKQYKEQGIPVIKYHAENNVPLVF